MQLDVLSLIITKKDEFFGGAGTENAMSIDDILTSQSHQLF